MLPRHWSVLSNIERKVIKGVIFDFYLPVYTRELADDYMLSSKEIAAIFRLDWVEEILQYEINGNIPKSHTKSGPKSWRLGDLRKAHNELMEKKNE